MFTGSVVLVVGAILTGWESVARLSDDCGEVEGKVSPSADVLLLGSVLCFFNLSMFKKLVLKFTKTSYN